MLLLLVFLFGVASGLRSMAPLAAVTWASHLGWLNLSGTPLALFDATAVRWILTLGAAGEWIGDKLPFIPSRKAPVPLLGRMISGAACGAALLLGTTSATAGETALSAIVGVVGALCGTFGGAEFRRRLVSATGGRDLPIALLEDAITVGLLLLSLHYLNGPVVVSL